MTPLPEQRSQERGEEERTAPILHSEVRIPWRIHERAAEQYNARGYGQSAERLADRGGFSWYELTVLLAGGDPYNTADPWEGA